MSHEHHHHPNPGNYNLAFAVGVGLNLVFVLVEAGYGIVAGSLALISDAGHNLGDVLGLVMAWGAAWLATKSPTRRLTYGFRRTTILASLFSAVLLLVMLGGIAWEAYGRFSEPNPVDGPTIIVVAAIGVVINAATALMFVSGKKHDLNIRAAYVHMAADAAVSVGVVVTGVAIMFSGWLWLDPLISMVIVVIVMLGTWDLLRDSLHLSVDGVPRDIDIDRIRTWLAAQTGVLEVHDLHVWALSTTETALTAHLITRHTIIDNLFLDRLQQRLHEDFAIDHTTIQIEQGDRENRCRLNHPACT